MDLLLTGSSGFIGFEFLLSLISNKNPYEKIWLPVRDVQKLKHKLSLEPISTDQTKKLHIFSSDLVSLVLPKEASLSDHVVHIAGNIYGSTLHELTLVNVEGTEKLLSQLKAPKKVIIFSSLTASGPAKKLQPKTEDEPLCPISLYGQSKLRMEESIKKNFSNLPYVIIRPPIVFGPRDKASGVAFRLTKQMFQIKPGFFTKYYSLIVSSDLISALYTLLSPNISFLDLTSRIYFVNSQDIYSDYEIIYRLNEVSGREKRYILPVPHTLLKIFLPLTQIVAPKFISSYPSLSKNKVVELWPRYWISSSKNFCDTFNWQPKFEFQQTLKKSFDWALLHAPQWIYG